QRRRGGRRRRGLRRRGGAGPLRRARVLTVLVDGERMREDFDALAAIGATPAGGVDRPSLGDAHLAARAWFLGRARAAGLEARVDAAGNHSAVLPAAGP